jgi:UDP-GlcNAc:undecaprenyl-phosphate/decaprenyl-phosphate GlcNAc-1-phosphate transferase
VSSVILWSLVPLVVALGTTLAVTPLVRASARRLGFIAEPSADRWHGKPTALLGGVGVFAGFLTGFISTLVVTGAVPGSLGGVGKTGVGILLAATVMFVSGLVDDWVRLNPSAKLIFQVVAASVLISFGVIYPVTPWLSVNILFTLVWFLGLTNALNLIDNMDGVAAGVSCVAAVFLAVTFALGGAWHYTALCLALAGATAGFLPYNSHPASIFMGDSGSLFIGALLAGIGAAYPGTATGSIVYVMFVPVLIVIIPLLDTCLVAVTRTVAGRPLSVGGRDHVSHRLVGLGLTERQVAFLLYGFAVAGGVVALLLTVADSSAGLWLGAVFLLGMLVLAAYLGRMQMYSPDEPRSGRPFTLLINDLLYKRRVLEVLLDLALFAVAYQGAYLLRWDGVPPPNQSEAFGATLALVVAAKAVSYGLFSVYRGTWQRMGIADVHRIAKAAILGSLLTIAVLTIGFKDVEFPRTILVLDLLLTFLLTLGARLSMRSIDRFRHSWQTLGEPVLIYGAGSAGEMLVREFQANPALGLRPVGFVDDDPFLRGHLVLGLPIVGGVGVLPPLLEKGIAKHLVIGTAKLLPERLQEVLSIAGSSGIQLHRLELKLVPLGARIAPPVLESPELLDELVRQASAPSRAPSVMRA